MKHLQKAVNKKQDISELKVDFEAKQRSLMKWGKQMTAKLATNQELNKSSS